MKKNNEKESKLQEGIKRYFEKPLNQLANVLMATFKMSFYPLLITAIVLLMGFTVFPEPTSYFVSMLSFGKISYKSGEEKVQNLPQYFPIERTSKCDSNFIDDKWIIEKRWKQDKENPQRFISELNIKLGGPKMDYRYVVPDRFHLELDFVPIYDEVIQEKSINLIIYIGDFYRLVLGDGNMNEFYLKQGEEFIPELVVTQREKNIPLPNRIQLNESVRIDIDQSAPEYSKVRTITVSFQYTPAELENAQPISTKSYVFQIEDSLSVDIVSRQISIGLLYNENPIITEFYCFKLEKN